MKTKVTTPKDIHRSWHHLNAKDQILGRIASRTAKLLIGKNKPYFSPNLDCGDYVVITNAQDIKTTGKKTKDKIYYHHTGYPGGLRSKTLDQKLQTDPRHVIELAVKGMLPKNKLRSLRLNRLKVFVDDKHPYQDKFKKDN